MTPTINQLGLWLPSRLRRGAAALWRETDGGWYGPRGACGCCESCSIFSDDFNRADDTDLGADWSEVSGSWSISSNRLVTSSTSAVAISTTESSEAVVHVSAIVRGASSDELRLIFAYEDTNNYWYAQATIGSSFLRIYSRVSGTDTLQGFQSSTLSASTDYRLQVCVGEDGIAVATIYAGTSSTVVAHVFSDGSPSATGLGGFGVGTGASASSVQFDSVTALRVSDDCEPCLRIAQCNACIGGFLSQYYMIEVSGVVAGEFDCLEGRSCDDLNGVFFMSPVNTNAPKTQCFQTVTPTPYHCRAGTRTLQIVSDSGGNKVTISFAYSGGGGGFDGSIRWALVVPGELTIECIDVNQLNLPFDAALSDSPYCNGGTCLITAISPP